MTKPLNIIRIILVLGCILSFYISRAQDYYEKSPPPKVIKPVPIDKGFSIAVSVGSAVPFKSFSSTNVKNSFWDFYSNDSIKLQGFAKPGINLNITASYLFQGGIGIMMMFGSDTNPFDIGTFSSTVAEPFTSSQDFHTREYLIGPYISFSATPMLTLEANALIGLVTANYPSVAIAVVDTTETISFNAGKGFGYSVGGAAKYSLTKRIAVSVNVAYTQTKMVYSGWTDTYTAPGYDPYVIPHANDKTNMPMGILKITAGIVFKFH